MTSNLVRALAFAASIAIGGLAGAATPALAGHHAHRAFHQRYAYNHPVRGGYPYRRFHNRIYYGSGYYPLYSLDYPFGPLSGPFFAPYGLW